MAFAEEKDPVDTLGTNGHCRILVAPGESLHRMTRHVAGRADVGMASFDTFLLRAAPQANSGQLPAALTDAGVAAGRRFSCFRSSASHMATTEIAAG